MKIGGVVPFNRYDMEKNPSRRIVNGLLEEEVYWLPLI